MEEFKVVNGIITKWNTSFDFLKEDIDNCIFGFNNASIDVKNFYVTVFLNRKGFKIGLYYSSGELTKINISKI